LNKTASVHAADWKRPFDEFLEQLAARGCDAFIRFDLDADYRRYVDGSDALKGKPARDAFFTAGEQKEGGNRNDRGMAKSARSVGSTTRDQDSFDLTAGRHQNGQRGAVPGSGGAGRGG